MAEYGDTRVEEDLCNHICDYLKDTQEFTPALVHSFEERRDIDETYVHVVYEDCDEDWGTYHYPGTLGQLVEDMAVHQSGKTRGLGRR
jgi:hypothetical protein